MSPRRKKLFRWALGVGLGLPLAFVGVIGFAHTKHGRFLLAYLPGMGACPMGYDQALAGEKLDAARATALLSVRGNDKAPARPALGFTLDETARADVLAWSNEHGVSCAPEAGSALIASPSSLRCRAVPASALPGASAPVTDLFLQFDRNEKLVALRASWQGVTPTDAVKGFNAREAELRREVGDPAERHGEARAEYLGAPLRQLSSSYVFSDYLAEVRATNVGSRINYDESYQSIPD